MHLPNLLSTSNINNYLLIINKYFPLINHKLTNISANFNLVYQLHKLVSDGQMKKSVLLILIGKRQDDAVKVQQILTAWGCIIKTRLGIHDGVMENCSDAGLLVLELFGSEEQKQELTRKVAVLPGVSSKLVALEI